jgi:hypothetical protein
MQKAVRKLARSCGPTRTKSPRVSLAGTDFKSIRLPMKHRELCENTTMSCTKLVMEIEGNDRLGNGPNIDPIMPRKSYNGPQK